MAQPLNDKQVADSLVNKVLKMQQLQQLQFDDLQKQLNHIQLQLHPISGLLEQLRLLNSLPQQLQQLADMQIQLRKLIILAESTPTDNHSPVLSSEASVNTTSSEPCTPTPEAITTNIDNIDSNDNTNNTNSDNINNCISTGSRISSHTQPPPLKPAAPKLTASKNRTTNNSSIGRVIPWPRIQQRDRSTKTPRSLISREIVVNTIADRLIQYVTIDFGNSMAAKTDTIIDRSHQVYRRLAKATEVICDKEHQLKDIQLYDNVPTIAKTRLLNLLERKAMEDMIRINLAENHWIALYFISVYFRNKHQRIVKSQRRSTSRNANTPRKRKRVGRPNVVTAIRSEPLPPPPPSSTSVSSPTIAKKRRGTPVVINETQDNDDDGDLDSDDELDSNDDNDNIKPSMDGASDSVLIIDTDDSIADIDIANRWH